MLDPRAVHIYTDGSCYGNPGGPSGCAARAEFPDYVGREEELLFAYGYLASTNNRMELLACIHSLQWVCESGPWCDVVRVQIVTDSMYLKNGASAAPGWRQHGGQNRHGEPMENWDLWKDFLRLRAEIGRRSRTRVDLLWMHDKCSPVLLRVHNEAKAAARLGGPYIDSGYAPGWVTRSMFKGAATRFKAAGQIGVIRPYRKKAMRNGEWKIRFDVVSDDGQSYVGSCYAYASIEMTLSELHSQNGYRVRFGDDPRHPQILEILEAVELPKRL